MRAWKCNNKLPWACHQTFFVFRMCTPALILLVMLRMDWSRFDVKKFTQFICQFSKSCIHWQDDWFSLEVFGIWHNGMSGDYLKVSPTREKHIQIPGPRHSSINLRSKMMDKATSVHLCLGTLTFLFMISAHSTQGKPYILQGKQIYNAV